MTTATTFFAMVKVFVTMIKSHLVGTNALACISSAGQIFEGLEVKKATLTHPIS